MPSKRADRQTWEGGVIFQGKRYRKSPFQTKREAVEWEVEKRKELERGEKQTTLLGFVSFCEQYLAEVRLRHVVKTFKEKKALTERLVDEWQDMEVSAITADHVRTYLNRQVVKRSANAANKDRKILAAMFEWGKKFMGLQENPVLRIDKFPHDVQAQYTPPIKNVLALLMAAKPDERVFLEAYLNTGGRRGEILRWTWMEDIDFNRKMVRMGSRKNRGGAMEYVWLPMTDKLYDELSWWWKNRPLKDSPYVFPSSGKGRGSHYGGQYVERRWFLRTLCKRAGVKYLSYHALRRYVASYLADVLKVPMTVIQAILRHKKLATTERYVQRINSDLRATMNMLGDMPPGSSTEEKEATV